MRNSFIDKTIAVDSCAIKAIVKENNLDTSAKTRMRTSSKRSARKISSANE